MNYISDFNLNQWTDKMLETQNAAVSLGIDLAKTGDYGAKTDPHVVMGTFE